MTGEYELRYRIRDISHFMKALSLSGASFNYKYKCTDYYYTPSGDMDYLNGKNLRIRHRTSPEESSTLYFDKYEIVKIAGIGLKRSVYRGGKVVLFIGDLKECRSIAKDLGFKPLFSINKREGRAHK